MQSMYIKRLRKLAIRRDRGTPIRCRICAVQWLPGELERHREDCPILKLTCDAVMLGQLDVPMPSNKI